MISGAEALSRLRDGNARFVSDQKTGEARRGEARRFEIAARQEPFAIVLGCSDSRVPAEIVFDQGMGDLFVIRVAGNIVAPSQVGSVEFAASLFHTRLVVVLGHSQCGAIAATLDQIARPRELQTPHLAAIVGRIEPAVRDIVEESKEFDHYTHASDSVKAELVARGVRANIRASVSHLRYGSALLERLVQNDGLLIVGAEYSLDSGAVEFIDV